MSLTVVYANRKNPPTFFTPLSGNAKADLFKIIKVYQGLKSLCRSFVGAAILRSLDGTKIAVYEQWKEETDFKTLADPVAHPEMMQIWQNSEKIQQHHDHKNLEFITGECNSQLPEIFQREHGMHLEVFKTQPNKLERLQAHCVARLRDQLLLQEKGLMAFSIHRTLDGTKFAIVGHWKSCEQASAELSSSSPDEICPKNLFTDRSVKIYAASYTI